MKEITQRMGQLRNAMRAQTARTRSAIERTAREMGVQLRTSRRRQRYHCIYREGEGVADKDCVQFACHQITDAQQRIVLDALRDQPALFHAFNMNVWSDDQHEAILERVRAHAEAPEALKRLLENP